MPMVGRLEVMVKAMPAACSFCDRGYRGLGQCLVMGQQGAIHVGDDKRNAGHANSSFPKISFTMVSTGASIDTVTACSSGAGGSSVPNWLVSSPGGMKWPLRWPSRSAISACVPSR